MFGYLFRKVAACFANSGDPDQMLHLEAYYLSLHCLPEYPF